MNHLRRLWIRLQSSFWFVPSLIVAGSVVLAGVLIEMDFEGSSELAVRWPRLFGAGADGAREMMSTIAGSMMTVVGVTFSIVLMVLALASSQYTSRILRNFMRSRITQAVLGIFAGIFTYSLIVLRTIRSGDESSFVPTLAVFFGFAMALGGVGALVFFIHHISSSIQASSIISSVGSETERTIDRLFPEELDAGTEDIDQEESPVALVGCTWRSVPSRVSGYVQSANNEALLRVARDAMTVVRMERGIGDFVVEGTPLVWLAGSTPSDDKTMNALREAFTIDSHRTVEEDAAFGIRQIVDMALKALSPGVNDTTTAVVCVDYLTSIMARLVTRRIPSSQRFDQGELRMLAKGPTFATLMGESFDQIRGSAKGNIAVLVRMFEALQTIATLTTDSHRRGIIADHVHRTEEVARGTAEWSHDHAVIEARSAEARQALRVDVELNVKQR